MAASTPIRVDNSPGRTSRVGGLIALVIVLWLVKVFAAYGRGIMAVTDQNPDGGSAGGGIMLAGGWFFLLLALVAALWFLTGRDVTTISAQSRKVSRGLGLVVPLFSKGCGFGDVSSVAVSAHRTGMDTSTYAVHVRYGPQGKRRASALIGRPVQDRSSQG
ncbi:MAG: hypothetical protein HYU66_07305 [Armatimonadetes bacterium]|nr:hypothetical protein [Armatimonadota bacterium]